LSVIDIVGTNLEGRGGGFLFEGSFFLISIGERVGDTNGIIVDGEIMDVGNLTTGDATGSRVTVIPGVGGGVDILVEVSLSFGF